MAEDREDGDEQQGPLKSVRSKKIGLFIIVGVLLLVIVGAGAVFAWMKFSSPAEAEHSATTPETATKGHDDDALGTIVDMLPFIVNLADAGTPRYLKVAIKLELNSEGAATRLKDRNPQVRDSLLLLLSSQESDKLRGIKGKLLLKDQIFQRVAVIVGDEAVRAVYLTDFVVQ